MEASRKGLDHPVCFKELMCVCQKIIPRGILLLRLWERDI